MPYLRMARVLPLAAGAMIVTLGPLGAGPAGAAARITKAAVLQPTAYIAACYTDDVIAMSTVTDTFTTYVPVGDCPDAMAITPNDKTVYVGNSDSDTVTPIATATNTAGSPIPVGGDPGAITMAPNGQTAYVTLTDDGTNTALVPIKTATNTAGTPIPLSGQGDITVTPDSKTVYAADGSAGVLPINAATGKAGKPIRLGADYDAFGVAVTPDGDTLLVTAYDPNAAAPGKGEVVAICTATDTVLGKALKIADNLGDILITPNGKTAYVSGAAAGPYNVYAVRTASDTLLSSFELGVSSADNMAITPDGKTVYAVGQVAVYDGSPWYITPINTATNTAEPPMTFQSTAYESYIAEVTIGGITPGGKTLYVIYTQEGFDSGWGLDAIPTATDTVTDSVWLATMGPGDMVFTP